MADSQDILDRRLTLATRRKQLEYVRDNLAAANRVGLSAQQELQLRIQQEKTDAELREVIRADIELLMNAAATPQTFVKYDEKTRARDHVLRCFESFDDQWREEMFDWLRERWCPHCGCPQPKYRCQCSNDQ